MPRGSTAAASCLKTPRAGRATAGFFPHGSHSQTFPLSTSSQDSQVPHGVPPPEQLTFVPARIRYASLIAPSLANRIASAPPPIDAGASQFETRIQPPSRVG